jgi:hypothetical protein
MEQHSGQCATSTHLHTAPVAIIGASVSRNRIQLAQNGITETPVSSGSTAYVPVTTFRPLASPWDNSNPNYAILQSLGVWNYPLSDIQLSAATT